MMQPQPIRVLFLGCGAAARIHSRVLRRIPGVELVYASSNFERAAEMCREYGGVKAWSGYDNALDDVSVDVAIVATPTSTHEELAIRALTAGKHVIIEKPAFLQASAADAVRDAARLGNRHVLVAENYIYKPVAVALRTLIQDDALGDVRFISLNATKWQPAHGWRAEPELSGGGALFEAGVHWISFAAQLGLEAVEAQGWQVGETQGADKSSLVVLRYANGAVATLAHSWELRGKLRGVRLSKVQGTRGSFTFESNGFASITTGKRTVVRTHLHDTLGYQAMHADFLSVLREGREPLYTLDLAQRDLMLLEMAQVGLNATVDRERPASLVPLGA
jgi:predicted dehydrogenase